MRRLAETLPTLRDGSASALPATLRIDPPAQRSFARPGAIPGAGPVPPTAPATSAFDVASLRSALLKRRHGASDAPPSPPFLAPRRDAKSASPIPPLDGPRERVEDRIAAALAAARVEAGKDQAAAVELARKVEREVAARALADARTAWADEEASAMSARFADAFEALHLRLSDAFGRAIAPIAEAAVRDVAVRRFAAVLDDLVGAAATAPALTVRGPADLVAALARTMGGSAGVAFAVADRPDLAVDIGDTRLETTLGAFAEDLARALMPPPDAPVATARAVPAAPQAEPTASPEEGTDVR